MMKESEEEFQLDKPMSGMPIIQKYQKPVENSKPSSSGRRFSRDNYHNRKPYNRTRPRR